MAISGVSPSVSTFQTNQTDPRQLFAQLTSAINSGDLDNAQQIYTQLSQALGGTNANSNNPFDQALNAIGQSLQSGDINGAQQALSSLQQQAQAGRSHHHHGHRGGGAPANTDTSQSSATQQTSISITATTGTTINLTA
jgi:outer membrane protein assembly factor BamD (BamD/ComL family)